MTLNWETDRKAFERQFGSKGSVSFVAAPGRVNLIGEHTDYHDGFVLPAAIDRHVRVLGRARADATVRIYSETFQNTYELSLAGPMAPDSKGWARRAEGIIRTVLEGVEQPRGLDIWIDADLPVGGGLSSSAASMAAFGMLAARINGIELDRLAFARVLQQAEHRFAGVRCGIMDQLAVLLGKRDHALLLDCRSLETRHVALLAAWSLVVMDTGVRHDLATSEYNKRQIECADALRVIAKARPEAQTLRDVGAADIDAVASRIHPVGLRRCRHVIAENERVHRAVAALESADARAIGELFAASHRSLRDDYEVSCPELDALVEAAWSAPGCIGARMTGGGFGGSTVNLVLAEKTEAFVEAVREAYQRTMGRDAKAIVTTAAEGAIAGELE
ncbi:MAG: galactokinase [Myxococcales bacterium]|jgi:galactokinase